MNGLFIFGLIFLAITLFVYPRLQKEVENPWCPNDVKAVSDNKKYFKIFLIVSISMIVIGGLLMIVS
jgi:hypothetical protein